MISGLNICRSNETLLDQVITLKFPIRSSDIITAHVDQVISLHVDHVITLGLDQVITFKFDQVIFSHFTYIQNMTPKVHIE